MRVALALVLVIVLLGDGVPLPHVAPTAPPSRTTTSAAVPSLSAPTTSAAPTPSSSGERSLCLLGVVSSCLPAADPGSTTAQATALVPSDPRSSWTNVTPPSGSPNPSQRVYPSMTYDPAAHEVLMFGGARGLLEYQDTWAYSQNRWSQLIANTSCTTTSCPSPREDAGMAYYGPQHAVLLFGGEVSYFTPKYVYNDTWLYYGGAWHNVTTTGPAPSPRFGEAIAWDSLDNEVVLFGGSTASGVALDDTWIFDGTWKNVTASLDLEGATYPAARAGANMAGSPSGYLLLFGGEAGGVILNDDDGVNGTDFCGPSTVALWFYLGHWRPQEQPPCIASPAAPIPVEGLAPPCGRVAAAVGWSPRNEKFVVFGGFGYEVQRKLPMETCGGTTGYLNDTWTYANPLGTAFNYQAANGTGDPANRSEMGFASDTTDGYFLIFGGASTSNWENETWRFYELVHAQLTGPSNIDTNASHLSFAVPFQLDGYGGTGTIDYAWSYVGLRTGNPLVDGGTTHCDELTNASAVASYGPLPFSGLASVSCAPTPGSYNLFRVTAHVWDVNNGTDSATANWTFAVSPPESIAVYSQFTGYFYSGISFPNNFSVNATVAGAGPASVSGSLANAPVAFGSTGVPNWWQATVDMGNVPAGTQVLQVTATFADNWVLYANLTVDVVEVPSWLQSVIQFPQVTQQITTQGAGPFNESFSITESFQWSLDKALGFNIQLPFVNGNVSLVPGITVSITATSTGNLSLTGSLSLTPPDIDLGPVSLSISITFSMKGDFTLGTVGGQITGVTWVDCTASITLEGKLSASVPIYGFDILGIKVGFTLEIVVDPSVTLGLLLAPTTPGFDEFIPGIQVKIQQFIGSFALPLAVAVSFGIGIASVAIGGQISIALNFASSTGLYIPAGWLNGTIFVEAAFLWWSDQWDLVSGTIYNWTSPAPTGPAGLALTGLHRSVPAYDNGTGTTWTLRARYYNTSGYDQNVWVSSESQGFAVSDVYPSAAVTGTGASSGAYLFYTDDNVSRPVTGGLGISGVSLNDSSNELARVAPPREPGFLLVDPRATTLPDGDLYLLWDAVPAAETSASGPADLTTMELQGAVFDPATGVWGATHTYTSWGLAQSFVADATGGPGIVVALVDGSFLLGGSTAERLLEFNLTSGAEIANVSVSGLSEIVSARATLGEAIVEQVGGNYSVLALATGASVALAYTSPIGGDLLSAKLAAGSPTTAVLLYREGPRALLALYDLASDTALGTLTLGGNAFEADAIANGSTYYVFLRTSDSVIGWTESGGVFANLTTLPEAGIESFLPVQFGTGIVVVSLLTSGTTASATVDLALAEVGAALEPVVAPAAPPTNETPPPGKSTNVTNQVSPPYTLYLAIAAGAVAVLLAVVAVVSRRRKPPATPAPAGPEGASAPEASAPPDPGPGGR